MRKLLRVERSIDTYKNKRTGYEKVATLPIEITVKEIKPIVTANDDDPLYYDGYVLTKDQLDKLVTLKNLTLPIDLNKYYYVLDCGGIYE